MKITKLFKLRRLRIQKIKVRERKRNYAKFQTQFNKLETEFNKQLAKVQKSYNSSVDEITDTFSVSNKKMSAAHDAVIAEKEKELNKLLKRVEKAEQAAFNEKKFFEEKHCELVELTKDLKKQQKDLKEQRESFAQQALSMVVTEHKADTILHKADELKIKALRAK